MAIRASAYFRALQDDICHSLEAIDGKAHFRQDEWSIGGGGEAGGTGTGGVGTGGVGTGATRSSETRSGSGAAGDPGPGGAADEPEGNGVTRILEDGAIFEKAGVNFSAVRTTLPEKAAARLGMRAEPAFATGISLVLHPESPMVPAVHMNLRHFELRGGDAWFGGGMDLTPFYLFEEDAADFHRALKACCDRHNPSFYPRFKKWCDDYFFLRHRGETRGVGGVFFDYQREDPEPFFAFVQEMGRTFLRAYLPIVGRRRNERWSDREKRWQLLRRGRYVEFNLVYDRGTMFGLESGGRTESILISLPPQAAWPYRPEPESGSAEHALLEVLRKPKEWA